MCSYNVYIVSVNNFMSIFSSFISFHKGFSSIEIKAGLFLHVTKTIKSHPI